VPYLIEPHIQVEVAPGVTLFGRPDRIDENTDASLHVIDYKGGSMPGDIDSGQLLFYALITELKYERRVTSTSFWYLDDGSLWTSEPSQADLQKARTELLATISTMNDTIDYLPTIARHCAGCPFLHACEVRDEVARVREQEGW
jgi:RecB family exonuclease